MSSKLSYRPDIDGLRAVAVFLVIGFHYFPATFPGGFFGVDIFFVISGFLIGGIIKLDLDAGSFTFKNFYRRRILRIFPGLIILLTCCFIAGYLLLLPDEFAALGKHIAAGALFSENFILWNEVGYFDVAARAKPLLNLWSLGIEEQFYFFFPFLLWFCYKKHLRFLTIVIVLVIFSFYDNIWLINKNQTAQFYSPLSRIWELLAGASLQFFMQTKIFKSVYAKFDASISNLIFTDKHNNGGGILLSFTGIILGTILFFKIREGAPWPGWHCLWIITAALCVICAQPENFINKYIFGNRIIAFVGRISYPLYLWHWPLISFAFILHGQLDASTRLLRLGILGVCCILSILTFLIIEQPIRHKLVLGRFSMPVLCGFMTAITLGGLYAFSEKGFPNRPKFEEMQKVLNEFVFGSAKDEACLKFVGEKYQNLRYCRYSNIGAAHTIAVIGDSHALHAYPGIAEVGNKEGFNTFLAGWHLPGAVTAWEKNHMQYSGDKLISLLKEKPEIDKVFIIYRGMRNITGIHNKGDRLESKDPWAPMGMEKFATETQKFINEIHAMGKKVYFVAENPELNSDPRDAIERSHTSVKIKSNYEKTTRDDAIKRQQPYLNILKNLKNCTVIDNIDKFCEGGICRQFDEEGVPLYFDDDHLSRNGSKWQAEHVLKPFLVEK